MNRPPARETWRRGSAGPISLVAHEPYLGRTAAGRDDLIPGAVAPARRSKHHEASGHPGTGLATSVPKAGRLMIFGGGPSRHVMQLCRASLPWRSSTSAVV
jgi:hypothetical protein